MYPKLVPKIVLKSVTKMSQQFVTKIPSKFVPDMPCPQDAPQVPSDSFLYSSLSMLHVLDVAPLPFRFGPKPPSTSAGGFRPGGGVVTIDISGNNLSSLGGAAQALLASVLGLHARRMSLLNVSGCQIGADGAKYIAAVIPKCK